jgi:CRP-like cAMP-binding protein
VHEFSTYLSQFGNLTEQQSSLLTQKASIATLQKGDYFLKAGAITQQAGFVVAGIFRVYYLTEQGDEITRYFINEGQILLNLREFSQYSDYQYNIQAVSPCEILLFSTKDWQYLSEVMEEWDGIVHKIIQHALSQKIERLLPMTAQDAAARYQYFLKKYPHLANRVPLAYLASYLGITQSSLSRVRKAVRLL